MEKRKKKRKPLLPATKKNFKKYKQPKNKLGKPMSQSALWKFVPDVK